MKTATEKISKHSEKIVAALKDAALPGVVVVKPRVTFTRDEASALIRRIEAQGFASCRLTLSFYQNHDGKRVYREAAGQTIRMRVFSAKALAQLLDKIDQVCGGEL